ncbi:type 1 glutamine amidotransferase [Loktanella sp. Alg231-35]|uniref:type 1 glutamine amidotransferase n=1 Tax=Loktanella sp. Alg231-35 TaxID=1922220 RepID=UPI000D559143|nr:type 1 glutamine amidotransferase [Loktanella sp. Alg231-35]
MKIGILQSGHAHKLLKPVTGDIDVHFERMLDGNGFEFTTFGVVDMEFPTSINDCDGWIITGSKHGAYDDLPFIAPLEAFIRDVYAANIPLVGICFGHQIIAQALGGKVEKFKAGWAVGRTQYDWNGETLALNAWHQDQVVERPVDATVHASNEFCENAALVYGNRVFTTQPHPEYGAQYIDGLIKYRVKGSIPDDQVAAASANLDKPVDNPRIAQQIAQFFKERTLA